MKRGILGVILLTACGYAHGMGWAGLWARPEQQTLAQREQAYAEIQGEQYASAAQHLQGFNDPVSQYDLGNALAHTGDLQGAITAYDAVLHDGTAAMALKQDAQHNRDLVEQQKKSQPQPDKSPAKDGDHQKNDQGDAEGKGAKGDKPSGTDKGQKNSDDNGKSPTDKAQGDKEQGEKSRENAKPAASDANAQNGQQPQRPEPTRGEPQKNGNSAENEPNPANARPDDASQAPPSEQAQSLDQWLRWIPDDPGGLLRRKFMIEHMLNQRGAQQ